MPILQSIALFFLVTVAIGGVAWVFLYPILSGERQTEKRVASVAKAEPVQRVRPTVSARAATRSPRRSRNSRRGTRRKGPGAAVGAARAGRPEMVEAAIHAGVGRHRHRLLPGGHDRAAAGLIVAIGLGFAGAFGVPFWLLSFLKKRRESEVSQLVSRCGRHHRARRQGRPAAARLHEDGRHRSARAAEEPSSAPSSRPRPSACRWARPAASSMRTCRCRRQTSSAS